MKAENCIAFTEIEAVRTCIVDIGVKNRNLAVKRASLFNSPVCQQFPDSPFAATYFHREDGKRVWSLRSRNGFDVSVVASVVVRSVSFDGCGCGFVMSSVPYFAQSYSSTYMLMKRFECLCLLIELECTGLSVSLAVDNSSLSTCEMTNVGSFGVL